MSRFSIMAVTLAATLATPPTTLPRQGSWAFA